MPRPVTSASPPIAIGDLAARRIISLMRVSAALLVAALASVEFLQLPMWVAWVAGLVWLPWAALNWFVEESAFRRARLNVALCTDLVAIGALMWILPDHADVIVIYVVPFAATLAYHRGLELGLSFAGAVLALRWGVAAVAGADTVNPTLAIAGTVALIGMVVLLDRALTVQRRDARSVARVTKKSDLILSQAIEGILVTSADGTILQANPAADRVMQASPVDPLVGTHCQDRLELYHGAAPLDCSTGCALVELCGEGGVESVEVWRLLDDDQRQPLLGSASPIAAPDGRIEMLHSFRDITSLRQADEAKTMFLATASHELKTPLTVIRGFTQVLRQTVDDPHAQTALDAIETRSRELAAIVDRLLLSSRIESGRIELTMDVVDVAQVLHDRLEGTGQSLGRDVRVELDRPLRAWTSAEGVTTVLDHLLDNAAKYSPGGEPITVRADTDGQHVRIRVVDRGIGMTADQVEQCFDRFWQAEATDVRRFGGTGIGLYIVQSLVDAMGAEVGVDSELGAGSTFTVILPVRRPSPEDAPSEDEQRRRRGPEHSSVDEFMHQLGLPSKAS